MRIRVVYQFGDSPLGPVQKAYLQNTLVPNAVGFWENALSVRRPAKLLVEGNCTHIWSDNTCARASTVNTCARKEIQINSAYVAAQAYCTNGPTSGCTSTAEGAGLTTADYILYIKAIADCAGSTLAYATACREDSQGRPIMGYANFCPSSVNENATAYTKQYRTALHEVAHALGFSASSWHEFRYDDGTKRTAPETVGTYSCPAGHQQTIYVPSENTVKQIPKRGKQSSFMIVTPRVKEVAQTYYGCKTLEGAELEDKTPGGHCLGSHWDERTNWDELMSPMVNNEIQGNRVSMFTLALFEDTGWYKPDYSVAESMYWGWNGGCSFVNEKCVNPSTEKALATPRNTFCNTASEKGCTYDLRSSGYCKMSTYSENLPEAFQYFSDKKQGGSEYADYCPLYAAYSNGDCLDTIQNQVSGQHLWGEEHSSSSFCALSSLLQNGWENNNVKKPGCFKMKCHETGTASSFINVTLSRAYSATTASDVTFLCNSSGQVIAGIPGFSGSFTCPESHTVCSGYARSPTVLDPSLDSVKDEETETVTENTLNGEGATSRVPHQTLPVLLAVVVALEAMMMG
jgi:leishmanolysin-like peptidase